VTLVYLSPPDGGELRQGEILADVREFWLPVLPDAQDQAAYLTVQHPLVILLTADCDLLQDFNTRFPNDEARERLTHADVPTGDLHLVRYVLACDLYLEGNVKEQGVLEGRGIKRVQGNQDERFHYLPAAGFGQEGDGGGLDDLYMDFKRTIALPTHHLYLDIRDSVALRRALVPPVYIHDIMHRFYGFLSRVAVD
jgi:hypothetical protein